MQAGHEKKFRAATGSLRAAFNVICPDAVPTSKRKASGIRRTEMIGVRVTPSQKRAIEEASARVALDPSTWLRMVGLERAGWNPADEEAVPAPAAPKKT